MIDRATYRGIATFAVFVVLFVTSQIFPPAVPLARRIWVSAVLTIVAVAIAVAVFLYVSAGAGLLLYSLVGLYGLYCGLDLVRA